MNVVKADNGMNIVGQGGWIMLFTAPALVAAAAVHLIAPGVARLPLPARVLVPLGVLLVLVGIAMWLTAVVQLLRGFPAGRLVTSGAYGVCRNPIYSSFALFVLPGVSLLTGTWVYFVVAAFLCLGVTLLIPKEERDLLRVFGDEYRRYTARVRRIVPIWRR